MVRVRTPKIKQREKGGDGRVGGGKKKEVSPKGTSKHVAPILYNSTPAYSQRLNQKEGKKNFRRGKPILGETAPHFAIATQITWEIMMRNITEEPEKPVRIKKGWHLHWCTPG